MRRDTIACLWALTSVLWGATAAVNYTNHNYVAMALNIFLCILWGISACFMI